MRISWRSVGKILARVVADKLERGRLDGLVMLGVDELSHGAGHRFLTCVADQTSAGVVWAAPGRKAATCATSTDSRNTEAAERLNAWLAWASRSRLRPFVKLARTIRTHKQGVLAAIQLGISNGRLEALNSRARLISHRAHGFHSPDALIAIVYLCCAGVQIELPHR